jgi:hypothetical protein
MTVRIQPEKSDYLIGEPTRLTVVVRNPSSNTLSVSRQGFYAITRPGSREELREDRNLPDPSFDVAPGDSVLFFLYPDYTIRSRDANGDWPRTADYRTFTRAGEMVVRASIHAWVKSWSNPYLRDAPSVSAWSNEVHLNFSKPRPREERILEAIWRSRRSPLGTPEEEAKTVDDLVELARQSPESPMTTHLYNAIVRMLVKPPIEFPDDTAMSRARMILSDDIAFTHPEFRPEEVAYYEATIDLRGDQAGYFGFSVRDARKVMEHLLATHPEVRANPEISFLIDRVHETGEEIAVRLGMDKRQFVVGEPMLFRICLANRSGRIVRAPGPMQLIPNSDRYACYIEIERPDGVRELRTTTHPITDYIGGPPEEMGLPLAPGDSIVAQLHYDIDGVASSQFGYRPSETQWSAFSKPGRYRVRAGCGLSPRAWRLNGAGSLVLSKSVEIVVKAPAEKESMLLETLSKATERGVFHAYINDATDVERLQAAVSNDPNHPLAFYLKRIIARAYQWGTRGMDADLAEALRRYQELLRNASGLRRQELEMQLLETYEDMNRRGMLVQDLRAQAERLVSDMQSKDPSLGTNQRFQYLACNIRLAEFGESGAGWAASWWLRYVTDNGPRSPSWDVLREVAGAAPKRPEPTGPFQPRTASPVKHR